MAAGMGAVLDESLDGDGAGDPACAIGLVCVECGGLDTLKCPRFDTASF